MSQLIPVSYTHLDVYKRQILYCVFYLLNLKQIKIYKNYLEIDNVLKKRRIYFVEITKLEKQFIKAKYNSWTNHYLILKSGKKIKLIEEEYSNFDEFYSCLLYTSRCV